MAMQQQSTQQQSTQTGQSSAEQRIRRLQWVLLVGVVLLTMVPTVVLEQHSRIFVLKLVIVAILTILPGWLYMQFIRFKGRSLYDEFVINLFRLHIDQECNLPAPPQHTSYYPRWKAAHDRLLVESKAKTTDNLYRRKFEAVYGRSSVSTSRIIYQGQNRPTLRDRTETFSPVLVATLVLGIGWALFVQPEFLRDFEFIRRLSGQPEVPYKALQFGFLGAYWFILQDLIRRYYRDDLKTVAYISAIARIVIVALVVTTAGLLPFGSSRQQQIFAFFIGIFPQIGIQALKAALTKTFGGIVPTIKTDYPLSDLEGLSIWDQARLLEEGIEDMQNLATANLVDVMLRTRVPISRLVDWLDQAFLCLRMPNTEKDPYSARRLRLRQLGIRTATDLQLAWQRFQDDEVLRSALFLAVAGDKKKGPAVVGGILATFDGEVNLTHVKAFKCHEWLKDDALPRGNQTKNGHRSNSRQRVSRAHSGYSPP
jgi:hypothetical protein